MTTVVWLKRDLRVHDHAPLLTACAQGNVIPLYIIEPELWQQPDMSQRHWRFIQQSLVELDAALKQLGGRLIIRIGEVAETLQALHTEHAFSHLCAHEETGNAWTYERDKQVIAWARAKKVTFEEHKQFGVERPLKSRDEWVKQRDALMRQKPLAPPEQISVPTDITSTALPAEDVYGDASYVADLAQTGGRAAGLSLLHSFLHERGERYSREMSSPLTGEHSCSRLSPHLAYGTVSLREIWHISGARISELKQQGAASGWLRSIRAFRSRLYWHCHFMQKLEDEPAIEHRCMHRAYEGLREGSWNDDYYHAWAEGRTGFPFIDACMRCLHRTGWINFRMRAMLVSFASYQLWLDWRGFAHHLSQMFTDYEPGIHYSQIQMQSNTTGINTPRIYNPVKQSYDQDPQGEFIRRWVPELAEMPEAFIHEPWKMGETQQHQHGIGSAYPLPIIEHTKAASDARKKLGEIRKKEGFWEESRRVMHKHGSRKHSHFPKDQTRQKLEGAKKPRRKQPETTQLDLPL